MNELQTKGETIFGDLNEMFFTSLQVETPEEKRALYKALNQSEPLEDNINAEITVIDVIIQKVDTVNQETGETSEAYRIILIDKDGKQYGCVSSGVTQSVKLMFNIFGLPTWEEGIKVKVVKKQGKRGYKYTTLEIL
jgi:hypothetical protein